MDDVFLVRSVEGIGDLPGILHGLIERQWALERKCADMRMIQRRDDAGFALEAFAELFLRNLDGDDAAEPRIAGCVDLAMPPAPISATIS